MNMASPPWLLPIGCYAIVVKRDAVERKFPGGIAAFQEAFSAIPKRDVHLMVLAFAEQELSQKLATLAAGGLMSGVDVAVADDLGRPLTPCAGVAFRRHRHSEYLRWCVSECAEALAIVEPPLPPPGVAVIGRRGDERLLLSETGSGLIILVDRIAEGTAHVDECLCAFLGRWGFDIGVYQYARGGRFALVHPSAQVEISDNSDQMVRDALDVCQWPVADWERVQYSLQRLAELKLSPIGVRPGLVPAGFEEAASVSVNELPCPQHTDEARSPTPDRLSRPTAPEDKEPRAVR
jgi:hypothetical protein